jgi:GTP cyclohydrolase II
VPIEIKPNPYNVSYLETKRRRMGHLLDELETLAEGSL